MRTFSLFYHSLNQTTNAFVKCRPRILDFGEGVHSTVVLPMPYILSYILTPPVFFRSSSNTCYTHTHANNTRVGLPSDNFRSVHALACQPLPNFLILFWLLNTGFDSFLVKDRGVATDLSSFIWLVKVGDKWDFSSQPKCRFPLFTFVLFMFRMRGRLLNKLHLQFKFQHLHNLMWSLWNDKKSGNTKLKWFYFFFDQKESKFSTQLWTNGNRKELKSLWEETFS